MSESADEIRRRLIAMRAALPASEVARRSRRIVERFAEWVGVRRSETPTGAAAPEDFAPTIALYRPSETRPDGEVDLREIERRPEFSFATFAYPRVVDRFQHRMDFAVPLVENDWAKGAFGLPEPRYELPALDLDAVDFYLIPGVAFGTSGERIGRGGGYYDRALANAKGAVRVGIAYDFQILDGPVPQAPWDARMDVIVTDLRVIEPPGRVFA